VGHRTPGALPYRRWCTHPTHHPPNPYRPLPSSAIRSSPACTAWAARRRRRRRPILDPTHLQAGKRRNRGLTGRSCSENPPPRRQASTRIGRFSRVLAAFGDETDRLVSVPSTTGSERCRSAALHQLANRLVDMLQHIQRPLRRDHRPVTPARAALTSKPMGCLQRRQAVQQGARRISPRRPGALLMALPLVRHTSVGPLPALHRRIP
jgi:hypothetical protein